MVGGWGWINHTPISSFLGRSCSSLPTPCELSSPIHKKTLTQFASMPYLLSKGGNDADLNAEGVMTMQQALSQSFGSEYSDLSNDRKAALRSDFSQMCKDEYDVGDPTMPDCIESENIDQAAIEYRRRIGLGNLKSYTDCLLVHAR